MSRSKSSKIMIRRAAIIDLDEILKLTRKLWDYHIVLDPLWRSGKQMRHIDRKFYREKLRSRNSRVYVAEHGDSIIGFFSGEIRSANKAQRYRYQGFINQAYVQPAFRGAGVGKQLLDEFIRWFAYRDIPYVELTVDSRNIKGHKAWSKMGFKEYIKRMRLKI